MFRFFYLIQVFFLVLFVGNLKAQQHYIIYFNDKGPETEMLLKKPQLFLSEKAIARRAKHNINLDETDLPVSKIYLSALKKENFNVKNTSKWLNAAVVETNLPEEEILLNFNFIKQIKPWHKPGFANSGSNMLKFEEPENNPVVSLQKNSADYGFAKTQNELLGLEKLHNKGYRGDGVMVAVLDVGFSNAINIAYFDSLKEEGRVKATYDYWTKNTQVYHKSDHGTRVLSILAANTPGQFVGTAPKADYLLAITDDLFTETHDDELYWIKAVEWADSIGADVVNSSLSYSVFDPGVGDYSYSDMDGETTISAKGANAAAAKGMLIVNSAGNGGHLCTPCDAKNILCVGGAQKTLDYDEISSFGPSYDKRIKPDVAAMTREVASININGIISVDFYGGTSSAAPQLSGLAACLLQAHPKRTNLEVISAIIESAHNYSKPDSLIGYGVPNAEKADSILSRLDSTTSIIENGKNTSGNLQQFKVYPNPANGNDLINVQSLKPGARILKLEIINALGSVLLKKENVFSTHEIIDISGLNKGVYFIKLQNQNNSQSVIKLIKN